ncbi:MAG TPA: type II toxin-antitoxin system prevent-host-death family antitoxin [Geminicoccus sp.]|uniref:type II toxin-antitoxin system Phd/YefM family antitoxin n=1 Tax=Geminicoccus sp. TaxID=2024832 RepID=UPI002CFE47A0|nr:type II toxin-antitoxin system prevent-host-death family antitoxin [Geminicoccus sp.]HWL70702.1 type II toxin-antitoxin system prevent-host-death family antitoxin [Geminicoccus sp.]
MIVNMHEAKSQLSKLVEAALRGEEVIIARAGKPVVRIEPLEPAGLRPIGGLEGTLDRQAVAFLEEDLGEEWWGDVPAPAEAP